MASAVARAQIALIRPDASTLIPYFESIAMRHVTVIAEDRTGLLAELTGILAARQINIGNVDARSYGKDVVIHLNVEEYEQTIHALEQENFHVVADEAVLLRVVDKPGALAEIAKRLADQNIDIRTLSVVQRHDGYSVVAVSVCDIAAARNLLADVLVV